MNVGIVVSGLLRFATCRESNRERALLGTAIRDADTKVVWDREELVALFGQVERSERRSAADIVDILLSKGVLSEDNGEYQVPIPSMQRWLVDYAQERELRKGPIS